MSKLFGQDPLIVGHLYQLRDRAHGEHYLVKVRSVEVGEDGAIRVGCAFHAGNSPHSSDDEDGYSAVPSCFAFPCDLRAAS